MRSGKTALMCAVEWNEIEIAKLLIETGSDLNIKDENGNTALDCAIKNNNIKMKQLLLKYIEKI